MRSFVKSWFKFNIPIFALRVLNRGKVNLILFLKYQYDWVQNEESWYPIFFNHIICLSNTYLRLRYSIPYNINYFLIRFFRHPRRTIFISFIINSLYCIYSILLWSIDHNEKKIYKGELTPWRDLFQLLLYFFLDKSEVNLKKQKCT